MNPIDNEFVLIHSLRQIYITYENESREKFNLIRQEFDKNGITVDDDDDDDSQLFKSADREDKFPMKRKNEENIPTVPQLKNSAADKKFKQMASRETFTTIPKNGLVEHCVFCFNNGERFKVFSSHKLRDFLGRVTCPRLGTYRCPTCNLIGDHTKKYCPKKKIITPDDIFSARPMRF